MKAAGAAVHVGCNNDVPLPQWPKSKARMRWAKESDHRDLSSNSNMHRSGIMTQKNGTSVDESHELTEGGLDDHWRFRTHGSAYFMHIPLITLCPEENRLPTLLEKRIGYVRITIREPALHLTLCPDMYPNTFSPFRDSLLPQHILSLEDFFVLQENLR